MHPWAEGEGWIRRDSKEPGKEPLSAAGGTSRHQYLRGEIKYAMLNEALLEFQLQHQEQALSLHLLFPTDKSKTAQKVLSVVS